ncbi:GNAT family N-acetyltransferase [Listeria fleischmannii]|uniref:GNAT family N-acetyltransferase n=1 Tax=Listeria fleischmannii TaxID=1069827 RepID=UPI001625028D|nr:GNAT family N-acetyltransferase [Listeria fleischmannii]MBC1418920.1 GNAT family N-acetyltransferase [Listeria fleischmannii]
MIRRLTLADYDEAISLLQAVKKSLSDHQWIKDYPNNTHISADLHEQALFGLFEENELVAVATLSLILDGTFTAFDELFRPKTLFIKRMMTAPYKQNRGLAEKLLDFSFQFAAENGFQHIGVTTETHNAAMKHLLFKKNFHFLMQKEIQNRIPYGLFLAFSKDISVPSPFLLKSRY